MRLGEVCSGFGMYTLQRTRTLLTTEAVTLVPSGDAAMKHLPSECEKRLHVLHALSLGIKLQHTLLTSTFSVLGCDRYVTFYIGFVTMDPPYFILL